MKYIFLDTNIYLHYSCFTQINWEEITSSSENIIVLPSITISEIDKKKWDGNREHIRNSARTVSKKISNYLSNFLKENDEPISIINNKLLIQFELSDPVENSSNQDDQLLIEIEKHIKKSNNSVNLVTSDNILKFKAKNKGIQVLDMPDTYLKKIIDEQSKKVGQLEKQIQTLEKNKWEPELKIYFKTSKSDEMDVKIPTMIDPATWIAKEKEIYHIIDEDAAATCIKKYFAGSVIEKLNNRGTLADKPDEIKLVTERHNNKVQNYINLIEERAANITLLKNMYNRFTELNLILSNTGKAPAKNIKIEISMPERAECFFFTEKLKFNENDRTFEIPENLRDIIDIDKTEANTFQLPKRPSFDPYIYHAEHQSIFERHRNMQKSFDVSRMALDSVLTRMPNLTSLDEPKISVNKTTVEIDLIDLKHHLTQTIKPAYVYIGHPKIKVLKMKYRIFLDNHPDIFRSLLKVNVLNEEVKESLSESLDRTLSKRMF